MTSKENSIPNPTIFTTEKIKSKIKSISSNIALSFCTEKMLQKIRTKINPEYYNYVPTAEEKEHIISTLLYGIHIEENLTDLNMYPPMRIKIWWDKNYTYNQRTSQYINRNYTFDTLYVVNTEEELIETVDFILRNWFQVDNLYEHSKFTTWACQLDEQIEEYLGG